MPTFKQRKTIWGLFSQDVLNIAVKDVVEHNLSIPKASQKHALDKSTLCRCVKEA